MQAWVFVITHRDSRKVAGGALVALEARYTTVCYFDAPRLDRRFAGSEHWKEIRHAFAVGLPTTPLPPQGALSQVLLGDRRPDVQLQWLMLKDVEMGAPEHTVSLLDDVLLRECAALKGPTEQAG